MTLVANYCCNCTYKVTVIEWIWLNLFGEQSLKLIKKVSLKHKCKIHWKIFLWTRCSESSHCPVFRDHRILCMRLCVCLQTRFSALWVLITTTSHNGVNTSIENREREKKHELCTRKASTRRTIEHWFFYINTHSWSGGQVTTVPAAESWRQSIICLRSHG